MTAAQKVALVTLGCARNEVDTEELAGRLIADGWEVVQDPAQADAVVVNTCGFVEVAKKDSIDAVLAAADLKSGDSGPRAVVAVGCLSERYGIELAGAMPEADAVLGFDDYPDISQRLHQVMSGEVLTAHSPKDRRTLLPISPVERPAAAVVVPGHQAAEVEIGTSWAPPVLRHRLEDSPIAPLKLASGCDRRCAFCAIPSFRGAFVSRPPAEVLAEALWLAGEHAKEVILVSENSTSYGKDLGDLRLLEALLPQIAAVEGIDRVRVAYLQPAEVRPSLLQTMVSTPGVADYFDLSFQHASASVLRRMRRFGGTDDFLALIATIRTLSPNAGIRSNFIVGFPGESQSDFDELCAFVEQGRLDAVGVFGYSDEDGTEAADLDEHLDEAEIAARVEHLAALCDEVMAQRAEERIGQHVVVLVEAVEHDDELGLVAVGHSSHQGPEDGATFIPIAVDDLVVGQLVSASVVATDGVDLIAERA